MLSLKKTSLAKMWIVREEIKVFEKVCTRKTDGATSSDRIRNERVCSRVGSQHWLNPAATSKRYFEHICRTSNSRYPNITKTETEDNSRRD